MRTNMIRARGTTKAFAILMAIASLSLPYFASADYVVAQNAYTVNQNAWAVGGWTAFDYVATSTVTMADRIDLNACVNGSIGGGEVVYMGIYQRTPYAYTHVASSSLTLAGNVLDCSVVSATTTVTFVFDTNLQWVSGVNLYFVLYSSNATSNFRLQAQPYGATNWSLYSSSTSALPEYPYTNINPDYIGISAKIRALGIEPLQPGGNIYNASSTYALCTTFDIGCYIATSFSMLFYPSIPLATQLSALASTTSAVVPFGYVSDLYDKFYTYSNTATTTLSVSVELSPLLNFMGASFSSTTVTVLSGAGLRTTMGPTMWALVQNLLSGLLWVGFGFYVYRRSIHLL